MDHELVEYLDRRFNEFRTAIRDEIRGDIAASAGETQRTLRAEIASSAAETRSQLHEEIAASAAETRRHFGVVAEQLMNKIQLVGERVIGVDQKVDRLTAEMHAEFKKTDRRILHLQARVLGPRD